MKQVKKYIAIGHWADNKDATYSVATSGLTLKQAKKDYIANEFVAYVVISEEKLNQMKNMSSDELFDTIRKMTTNYRKWMIIYDYIQQCMDIMEDHLANLCMD